MFYSSHTTKIPENKWRAIMRVSVYNLDVTACSDTTEREKSFI